MASPITDETRKRMETFIKEHPPYEDDDPILQVYDHPDIDPYRIEARMYKALLDGKV